MSAAARSPVGGEAPTVSSSGGESNQVSGPVPAIKLTQVEPNIEEPTDCNIDTPKHVRTTEVDMPGADDNSTTSKVSQVQDVDKPVGKASAEQGDNTSPDTK